MRMALSRRASLKTIAAAAAFPAAAHAASSGVAAPAIKLVVLDVGGTIIQDHGEVPKAMQSALGHGGVPASLAEINDWLALQNAKWCAISSSCAPKPMPSAQL